MAKDFGDDLFSSSDGMSNGGMSKIDVVKMDYVYSESITWQELFSGFNSIKAITFSSGIGFVYQLLDLFKDAEIIFGCEEVMSYTLQEIMAYQAKLMERIRKTDSTSKEKMIARVERGDVRLFVARRRLSHEKLYLLKAEDGRARVVFGSANMSFNAFGGRQREIICYIDSQEAYERFEEAYEDLKQDSVDAITKKAIEISDSTENVDALPIAETARVEKAIYIEPVKDVEENVNFILDTRNLAKRIAPSISISKEEKRKGKVLVTPDVIQKVKRQQVKESEHEKELRSEYPQLAVDVEKSCVLLNGVTLDLHPTQDEIKSDVELFIRYMNGFERFHGDCEGMQYRYYEFANWFFCSPFMAVMRDTALRYDQKTLPYPVFGLIYGQSKAGKTSFLETLLKMMIGQKR